MSRKTPEAPFEGIPIRHAQIEWTPKQYADMPEYAETLGHAVVIDRREIRRLGEEGLQHPLVHKYPCSHGAAYTAWAKQPTQFLIMRVMRLCLELLLFDEGIEKQDIFNILHNISETRFIFPDDVMRYFGCACPNEDESEAYDKYLRKLYGYSD